jgi:hypothetical protein
LKNQQFQSKPIPDHIQTSTQQRAQELSQGLLTRRGTRNPTSRIFM